MKTKIPFSRRPKVWQRKAIARDVLARLKSNQLIPTQGRWAYFYYRPTEESDVQQLLRKGRPCQCCALGGAICALAAKEDKIQTDGDDYYGYNSTASFDPDGTNRQSRRLISIFGEDQLKLIESFFECGKGVYGLYDESGGFFESYSTPAKRMKAIFTQIAKTGIFNPLTA